MDDNRRKTELIRRDLSKAHDDLETAEINLAAAKYRGAVNRAYYSIFHATEAVLLWHNIERSKHSGVESAFAAKLVKPKLIEREYFDIFRASRELREDQDYERLIESLSEAAAAKAVSDAKRFVARIERYLRETSALE